MITHEESAALLVSMAFLWLLWRSDYAKLQELRTEFQQLEATTSKLRQEIDELPGAEKQRQELEATLCRITQALQRLETE